MYSTRYYLHSSQLVSLFRFDFFFYCYAHHRVLHSFPTRRSSDLAICRTLRLPRSDPSRQLSRLWVPRDAWDRPTNRRSVRLEEHTSELQSQFHLVCRLLLEKKKT